VLALNEWDNNNKTNVPDSVDLLVEEELSRNITNEIERPKAASNHSSPTQPRARIGEDQNLRIS